MDYPKSVPNIGLVDGHFVDENPITGQIGSLIPAAWGDAITQEVLNVIKGAGMVPDEANVSQLLSAVLTIAASDFKKSVRVATTGPIALSGLQTVDGTVLVAGDRVLVKNQANAAQNWIYLVAPGAWVRAQDANESAECTPGHLVSVQAGTVNAGSIWQLSNTLSPVLGTTALNFVLALGKTGVAAGTYRQVVVDAWGRITGGSNPTTLGGYGITDAYTKSQVYTQSEVYTQSQVNELLLSKPNKSTNLSGYGITDAYTKLQVDSALSGKADKGTKISDYGITDTFTFKSQAPNDIAKIYDLSVVYQNPSSGSLNGMGIAAGCVLTVSTAASGFQLYGRDDLLLFRGHTVGAYGQVRKIWHDGNLDPNELVPPGTTIAFAGPTPPAGFLRENGALVSRTTYARLFAAIGTTYGAGNGSTTFALPDSRGLFMRGLDGGRGIDPGRSLGTDQEDQLQGHRHDFQWGQGANGSGYRGNSVANYAAAGLYSQVTEPITDGVNGAPRVGSETRPINTARMFCIKY